MALNEKSSLTQPIQLNATAGSSSSVVVLSGSTAPDGNTAPWSDAKIGSLHIRANATDDTSPWYLKVDEDGADDDWVQVFVDLSQGALSLSETLTMTTDKKVFLRGTDNFIHSNSGSQITITAASTVTVSCALAVGDGGTRISNILAGSGNLVVGALASSATSAASFSVTGLTTAYKTFVTAASLSGCTTTGCVFTGVGTCDLVVQLHNQTDEALAAGTSAIWFFSVLDVA